jgi:hypothetical protein
MVRLGECGATTKRRRKNRLLPFIPVIKGTMATPAWRAMAETIESVTKRLGDNAGLMVLVAERYDMLVFRRRDRTIRERQARWAARKAEKEKSDDERST